MGIFTKLYQHVMNRGKGGAPAAAAPSERERIRQTAADDYQRRAARQDADIAAGLASLKARIASESAQILESLGKPEMAAFERDHAQRRQRQAEMEHQLAQTPELRFMAGAYALVYGRDFGSSNPAEPAVFSVWYVPAAQELYVQFFVNAGGGKHPGPTYKYWPVSKEEARKMFRASSKGIAVWDQFRLRGTTKAHRKSYALVSAGRPWG